MNRLIQYIFLWLIANASYGQAGQLQDCWWKAVKVVEVIKGDTTIYRDGKCKEPYDGKHSIYFPADLRVSAYFAQDLKFTAAFDPYRHIENNPTFNPVKHVPETRASGTWQMTGNSNIEITLDPQSTKEGYDRNFSGDLSLVTLTDSTVIFQKEIVRNGDWTRTYHFVKR